MTAHHSKKGEHPGLFKRVTSTVNRCHLLGAITATALMLGIGWVFSCSQSKVSQIEFGGTVVNLDDARELIKNANHWRQQYWIEHATSQNIDELVKSISKWLPETVDWPAVEQDVHAIAATAEMTILAIEKGDLHVGQRVGVVAATCTVRGSYQSLCQFLSALEKRPHPIACSEMTLHRVTADQKRELGPAEPVCSATLSLRIPFAASGTAAGRLLSTETNNAS